MLAAELCLRWGIDDVEGWLDAVEPRVMDFWMAVDQVSPIGDEWRQTAELKQMLSQLLGMYAATCGASLQALTVDDCMPARYRRQPVEVVLEKKVDKKAEFAALGLSLGFKLKGD